MVKITLEEEFEKENYLKLQNEVKKYIINFLLNTKKPMNKQLVGLVGLLTYCKESSYKGDDIGVVKAYRTREYDLYLHKYDDNNVMSFKITDKNNNLIFKKFKMGLKEKENR